MTDTTAPRTAAPLSADEEAELRQDIIEHDPATAESIYGIDVLQLLATLDAEREAIEPLLALVRALEAAKIPHLVVDGDCWYSCGLAVDPYDGEPACCNDEERGKRCTCGADRHNAAIDEAIAALPESVRVAARKPE